MKTLALAVATLIAVPTFAAAETPSERSKGDADRRICRTESVTGSRLAQRKRCMTAAEWTEQAMLDRQSLERTQSLRWKGSESTSGAVADPFRRGI